MNDPVDPDRLAGGPATRAVRSLLRLAMRTRWFEPAAPDKPTFFRAHVALVRAHVPGAFTDDMEITEEVGGWAALERLASQVRHPASTFDWKFGTLKTMVKAHSEARGWSAAAHARAFQSSTHSPGDLFVLLQDQAFWRMPFPTPELVRAGTAREAAAWFASFATGDLIEAIEWQLAEGTDDLESNPMLPLLLGYAMGQYPFVLDASRVVVLRCGEPLS